MPPNQIKRPPNLLLEDYRRHFYFRQRRIVCVNFFSMHVMLLLCLSLLLLTRLVEGVEVDEFEDDMLRKERPNYPMEETIPGGATRYYYADGRVQDERRESSHDREEVDVTAGYVYDENYDESEDEDEQIAGKRYRYVHSAQEWPDSDHSAHRPTANVGADGTVYETEDEVAFRETSTVDLMVQQVKRDWALVTGIVRVLVPPQVKAFLRENYEEYKGPVTRFIFAALDGVNAGKIFRFVGDHIMQLGDRIDQACESYHAEAKV